MLKLVILMLIIFLVIGLDHRLTVTKYTLQSKKIKQEINIVLLTDLHSCYYGKSQGHLIETIHEQHPDMILLSGDIADDRTLDDNTEKVVAEIGEKYPCYYAAGNHEFRSGRVEEQKAMLRSHGVHVLEGSTERVLLKGQEITVCGVDDPEGGEEIYQSQLKEADAAVVEGSYSILISHRPERFEEYSSCKFDLVVSGHAHGGQWSIPYVLPNGLYAPNQGLFPKYTRGVHTHNGTTMVVSRGLARESTLIPRFYNRPEVVVVKLS